MLSLRPQRVLLLAVLPPHAASRARLQQRGASQHRVPPRHLGPIQHLPAAGLHVHLQAPPDSERGPRGAQRCHLPADGPRGRHLPGVHAAALVRKPLPFLQGNAFESPHRSDKSGGRLVFWFFFFFFQQGKDERKAPSPGAGLCSASSPRWPQPSGPTLHRRPEIPHSSDRHKVRATFGTAFVKTDSNFLLSSPVGLVCASTQVLPFLLCLLLPVVGFLTHDSTSFVSAAGSRRMSGALSSRGFSQPASPGQSGRRRGHGPHRDAVLLQKVPPAPTANQIPRQSQTPAARTLW